MKTHIIITLLAVAAIAYNNDDNNKQNPNNTIALFQDEIKNGSRQDVKDYASKYLPHIQMHLTSADSISTALNGKHKKDNNNGTGGNGINTGTGTTGTGTNGTGTGSGTG